jgi:hypothetical protein
MRVRLPLMIQDPDIAATTTGRLVETWTKADEDHWLDGPVTPRVAVLDLDPTTEALGPGAPFEPPAGRRTYGRYRVDLADVASPAFIATSVFGTVLRTMYLYEEPDTLGRRVAWGFDGPQLLVVPRAGWLQNAYYERRSRSLQFFSFHARGTLVHTALSRDIVAHETAHALIDGIDPDLYDALDPQSLAIHEGVADLTAMLIAFRSHRLRKAVLDATHGSIEQSTAFSSIGEEFGRAIDPSGRAGWLRNLNGEDRLDPKGRPGNEPEPHQLSTVLTGALYKLLIELHRDATGRMAKRYQKDRVRSSGLGLFIASEQFKRMILRGLDYLPPGEATFADLGRAILAADQASFRAGRWRQFIREEFVRRGIVRLEADLAVRTNVKTRALRGLDLQALVDSAWSAYMFAEANRELLGIPDGHPFEVLPRIVVNKRFELPGADRPRGGQATRRPTKELLFKVRWSVTERNPRGLGAPTRRIQTGTTLVIDWDRKVIRSCLGPLDLAGRRRARDATVYRLVGNGLLQVSEPDDPALVRQTIGTGVEGVVTDGILRVRGTGRLMHIVRGAGDA